MPIYRITPQDVLFFRDGRPMTAGAGSGGHGARWPEPSIIFDALHAALYRAFPEVEREGDDQPTWEHEHRFGRSSNRDHTRQRTQRFGSLATVGPFPVQESQWYFPCPQDVTQRGQDHPTLLPLQEPDGANNLPAPLRFALGSVLEPDKEGAEPWLNKAAIERYLGSTPDGVPLRLGDDDLFAREWNTGIAIDPATQTTGQGEATGKIYSAEYLRLRAGVHMGIQAQMPLKNGRPDQQVDGLGRVFPANHLVICGGQQRACHVEELAASRLGELLPVSAPIRGERMKWVLLSPSVFPRIEADLTRDIRPHPGGWLPTWVCAESGRVLLKKGDTERGTEEPREAWRKRVRAMPQLNCHLVAARIPKPIVLTGWSERLHLASEANEAEAARKVKGARPTLLAVPAGAVYYFEGPDAPELADALSWHGNPAGRDFGQTIKNRRSTLLGEKGYGLGVCGTWSFFPEAANPAR
jgi:CRISPR type III-B/RAMP module-associated protein Cmr3